MATLQAPSPTPSPGPANGQAARNPNARASMGPTSRIASVTGGAGLSPSSPRPGGMGSGGNVRPTSELLGGAGLYQTPEAEAIDQWFENLQNYEATLEDMVTASLDVHFKEELSAIEQWFRVLSEAERTAALYSLLQHSTQVQIRFFITVLQQMARSDPMTALLSPSAGGSMQTQMEQKLNSMGLKSPNLSSPSGRSFGNAQRQSLAVDNPSSFLSPDTANLRSPGGPNNGSEAANTLATQRARLKANAAHRISAPGTLVGADGNRNTWAQGASQLGQLSETSSSPANDDGEGSPGNNIAGNTSNIRPKSTDFSGVAATFRNMRGSAGPSNDSGEELSPMPGGSWASQVNTPAVAMFNHEGTAGQTIDNVTSRLASWNMSNTGGGKMQLDDAKKYRRVSKNTSSADSNSNANVSSGVYDENGNLIATNGVQPGQAPRRSISGASSGGGNQFLSVSPNQWGGAPGSRSPSGYSNVSSGRFGSDDSGMGQLANMPNFGLGNGLGSPGMGLGLPGFAGMGVNGLNMNMLNAMNGMGGMNMGLDPNMQAQLLAAQLAAANGGMFNPALFSMQAANMRNMRGGGRSPGGNKSNSGRDSGNKDKDEEVDPKLLDDIPAWLRSLRLHKYTPNFQNMNWKDMVIMDEAALEAKGVAALGARRKMLKTFEQVRAKMGIEMANPPAIPA